MAISSGVPALSFQQFDGEAPGPVWREVAGVFQTVFAAAPYFEDPVELADIVQWGPGRLASGGGRLVVARCGGKVVGFSLVHGLAGDQDWAPSLLLLDASDVRVAEMLTFPHGTVVVDELAVHPEYRGLGAAKECLARSIGDRSETRVLLGVFDQAKEARAMYARWGFGDLGTAPVRDGAITLHALTAESAVLQQSIGQRQPAPAAPVAVSYVIFRRSNQVLLQLRQGTGYMDGNWSTAAAGHVEAGETGARAAVREVREELGIDIAPADLVPLTTMHRTPEPCTTGNDWIDYFFACNTWSGEPRIMEPDRNAGLHWFSLDDLPAAVVPHERYVLERLRAGVPPTAGTSAPTSEPDRR